MKKHLYASLFAGALLAALPLNAQTSGSEPAQLGPKLPEANKTEDVAPPMIEQNGQKFVLVSTIKTIDANREFQNNVNIVQAQRKLAVDMKQRIDIALTTPEKEALQKKLDETLKSLEENNKLMAKTYGFSLTRNYVVQVVKTRLYTPLSDEEYNKLPDEDKNKPDQILVVDSKDEEGKDVKKRFLYVAAINGAADNDIFRQNVQLVQAQRQRVSQLTNAQTQVSNEDDKKKIEEELKKSEEMLIKNNDEMIKRYGFSLARNYVMEIEEARLYTALTEEEAKKAAETNLEGKP